MSESSVASIGRIGGGTGSCEDVHIGVGISGGITEDDAASEVVHMPTYSETGRPSDCSS